MIPIPRSKTLHDIYREFSTIPICHDLEKDEINWKGTNLETSL